MATDFGGSIGEMTMGNTAPGNWLSSCTCSTTGTADKTEHISHFKA